MEKTAILLVNLGTPDEPTPEAVKVYLREFLSDPRIIDIPRWKWLPILNGIILPRRSKKSAALYQSIWTEEGSPLLVYTKKQQELLQERFSNNDLKISMAMNYGNPSVTDELEKLHEWGVRHLVVLPLFPQYSSTTTASIWDHVQRVISTWFDVPKLTFIRDYPDHPKFIETYVQRLKAYINKHGEPDAIVASYHGIPLHFAESGDDYEHRCSLTTDAIQRHFPNIPFIQCYQSKFGKDPWLEPNTSDVLKELPMEGKKHVLVIAPGFTADCLETLEELEIENAAYFKEAGGEKYYYIPAANDDELFIDCLEDLVKKEIAPYLVNKTETSLAK